MKNKKLLIILILVIAASCKSAKKSTEVSTVAKVPIYSCLDTITAINQMQFYKLKLPNDWCTYIGSHDVLSHSPKSLINSKKELDKNYLTVRSNENEIYKSDDIEKALSKHVIISGGSSKYKMTYTSDMHEVYGKYYILKKIYIRNSITFINLEVLFNYKYQDYIINYYVEEDQFEKNLNDVIEIISSFTIIPNK